MPCFIGGKMKALTNSQLIKYTIAQGTFTRINNYNRSIQTKRLAGDTTASYYVFSNSNEQDLYTLGRFLLVQNDPNNAALYIPVDQV
jgi:hypothetical protein